MRTPFHMHQKDNMDRSALLVVVFATLTSSTDAKLTWNDPVTSSGTYTMNIIEGTTVFTPPLIISISTTAAKGKTITYSVTSTGQGPFKINNATGEITLNKALDYEAKPNTYNLTITATEVLPAGVTTTTKPPPQQTTKTTTQQSTTKTTTQQPITTTPNPTTTTVAGPTANEEPVPETAKATVTINVLDKQTFANNEASVCVPDGAKAGDVVTTLPIADKFNEPSASYSISGTGHGNFTVNSAGKVTVATGKNITKGDGDSYTLTIEQTGAKGTLTLTVTVGDCSVASLMAPLGLLTLLMALVLPMN